MAFQLTGFQFTGYQVRLQDQRKTPTQEVLFGWHDGHQKKQVKIPTITNEDDDIIAIAQAFIRNILM